MTLQIERTNTPNLQPNFQKSSNSAPSCIRRIISIPVGIVTTIYEMATKLLMKIFTFPNSIYRYFFVNNTSNQTYSNKTSYHIYGNKDNKLSLAKKIEKISIQPLLRQKKIPSDISDKKTSLLTIETGAKKKDSPALSPRENSSPKKPTKKPPIQIKSDPTKSNTIIPKPSSILGPNALQVLSIADIDYQTPIPLLGLPIRNTSVLKSPTAKTSSTISTKPQSSAKKPCSPKNLEEKPPIQIKSDPIILEPLSIKGPNPLQVLSVADIDHKTPVPLLELPIRNTSIHKSPTAKTSPMISTKPQSSNKSCKTMIPNVLKGQVVTTNDADKSRKLDSCLSLLPKKKSDTANQRLIKDSYKKKYAQANDDHACTEQIIKNLDKENNPNAFIKESLKNCDLDNVRFYLLSTPKKIPADKLNLLLISLVELYLEQSQPYQAYKLMEQHKLQPDDNFLKQLHFSLFDSHYYKQSVRTISRMKDQILRDDWLILFNERLKTNPIRREIRLDVIKLIKDKRSREQCLAKLVSEYLEIGESEKAADIASEVIFNWELRAELFLKIAGAFFIDGLPEKACELAESNLGPNLTSLVYARALQHSYQENDILRIIERILKKSLLKKQGIKIPNDIIKKNSFIEKLAKDCFKKILPKLRRGDDTSLVEAAEIIEKKAEEPEVFSQFLTSNRKKDSTEESLKII